MRSYIVAGLPGAGKTTAKRYAERAGYATASLGETVRRAYDDRGRDESIAEFVLRTHETAGRAAFAREAIADLEPRLAGRHDQLRGVVVEGAHSMASVRTVRRRFGRTSVVWIQAPVSLRLRRLRQRENGVTEGDLLQRDLRELNSGLSGLAAPSGHEYHVRNDGSRRALEQRLGTVFE